MTDIIPIILMLLIFLPVFYYTQLLYLLLKQLTIFLSKGSCLLRCSTLSCTVEHRFPDWACRLIQIIIVIVVILFNNAAADLLIKDFSWWWIRKLLRWIMKGSQVYACNNTLKFKDWKKKQDHIHLNRKRIEKSKISVATLYRLCSLITPPPSTQPP